MLTDAINGLADAIANLTDRIRALESGPNVGQSYNNLLLNGGFEKWALGAGPFTADGATFADSWTIQLGASSTISIAEDTVNQDAIASSVCAAITNTIVHSSYVLQTVTGPFIGTPIALSMRIKTSTPNAVRLFFQSIAPFTGPKWSAYHTGSGKYETLSIVGIPQKAGFIVYVEFDKTCVAYVDSAMAVQGVHPIDYLFS